MKTNRRLLLYSPSKNTYIKGIFYQSETIDSRDATNFRFLFLFRWLSLDIARRNFSEDYKFQKFLNMSGEIGLLF